MQWRLDEWQSENLQPPEILQPLYHESLKVLGLVVSHSVFSPFYSRTPIMLNFSKFKTWSSALNFLFTSVNDRTNCPAIQGFDRTKPIFGRTLSVDRPLFQALLGIFWVLIFDHPPHLKLGVPLLGSVTSSSVARVLTKFERCHAFKTYRPKITWEPLTKGIAW